MYNFKNVKIGDKLIVWNRHRSKQVAPVIKVNKTSFVCQCDGFTVTFNFDGFERGGNGWSSWYCDEWTAAEEEKINKANKKEEYIRFLTKTDFTKYSLEELEEIVNSIKKFNK